MFDPRCIYLSYYGKKLFLEKYFCLRSMPLRNPIYVPALYRRTGGAGRDGRMMLLLATIWAVSEEKRSKMQFLTSVRLHRLNLYVVLRKLIPKLLAFSKRVQETPMVRFYSSIDADVEMLTADELR
jgi:hypothetical protein